MNQITPVASDTARASALTIKAVNPHDLWEQDFVSIHEVSQDMWASESGLWELVRCNCCGKMLSKEAIFGHLSKELQDRTVAHIMRTLDMTDIACTQCGGDTRFIYGSANVRKIKERVLGSVDSFLVLATNDAGDIVGFEEGYVDRLERIFDLDLALHYRDIGVREISGRVERALGYAPEELLFLSSIGLIGPYQSFPNLLEMMNQFSRSLPDAYIDMPGITELDRNGVTYKMGENLNIGISLGIREEDELRTKLNDIWERYDSDLVVYHDPVRIYKASFTQGLRHFLKLTRRTKGSPVPSVTKTPSLVNA